MSRSNSKVGPKKPTIGMTKRSQAFKKALQQIRREARTLPNYFPMPRVV